MRPLYTLGLRFGAGKRIDGVPQVYIEQILVLGLGFGEQNVISMQLLLAIFGGFAASLIGLLLGFLLPLSLVRLFEPNFLFALFGSEL